ncbi:hypothetical protein [Sorangium sp. So ce887]|uniref:hypothetical protein n=1 Tax=Sorangium sp. So ce887 TaxID=3133324 RepID=UPI003F5E832A
MVEGEGTIRSITLEELAAITGALEAGLPRDEVLAGAGLSVEAWEAAREGWMSRLAARAARGQLRSSQRYLELVAEQKGRAEARARHARRKPEGPIPVAPAAHLSPLQGAPRDRATPLPAAGAGGEAAARSPWARLGAAAPPGLGVVEPAPLPSSLPPAMPSPVPPAIASSLPPAMPSPLPPAIASSLPPAMPSPLPPAMPSPMPAVTPTPFPDPPPTAPPGRVTLLGTRAVAPREALPFRQDASSAPRAESAATPAAKRKDATRIGAVGALSADRALPFSRTAPVLPADKALPFSRPTPSPPADKALPFSRPTPSPPADKALPFSRPTPSPPADKALPFSRPTSSGPVKDETAPLPPQRSQGSWALPFQQPSSASGSPASASTSEPAVQAQPGVDEQEMRRVERITLGEYARICADARDRSRHIQQIQSHYGLSPQGWAALHAMWHERFRSDPALKARWQALVEQSAGS